MGTIFLLSVVSVSALRVFGDWLECCSACKNLQYLLTKIYFLI